MCIGQKIGLNNWTENEWTQENSWQGQIFFILISI